MLVIMIARLHAMYQRSRKVLIFLVVIFLAITIINVVIAAIITTQITGGKLWLCMKCLGASGSFENTRGIRSLRHLSVHTWPRGRFPISDVHDLDTWYCMGGPCTVSRGLDFCQAFPWTTTALNKWDYWGLFHGVDENSRELLCEVRSQFECSSHFPLTFCMC